MTIRQIDKLVLPNGMGMYPHVYVDQPPSWFESQHGIMFSETFDDLDYLDYADLEIDISGQTVPIMLSRYRGYPENVTAVSALTDHPGNLIPKELFDQVLDELQLSTFVNWTFYK